MSDEHQYFKADRTACTIQTRGARAIICGDAPRKNADGTTTLMLRGPLLIMPSEMWDDADEIMEKVARILNEHAAEFFESARALTGGEP